MHGRQNFRYTASFDFFAQDFSKTKNILMIYKKN